MTPVLMAVAVETWAMLPVPLRNSLEEMEMATEETADSISSVPSRMKAILSDSEASRVSLSMVATP
jgi:hypothetical protein